MSTESRTRKEIIDIRLGEAGWNVSDRTQVIEELLLSSAGKSGSPEMIGDRATEFTDYVLLGRNGKPLAVVEAKRSSKSAQLGREQAKQYCQNIRAQQGGELPF